MSVQSERIQPQLLPLEGVTGPPPRGHDQGLDRVEQWWRKQGSADIRIGNVIRQTFDEVLDAERTGRYDLAELGNDESAYLAARFRIILRDEFALPTSPGATGLPLSVEGLGVEALFEPLVGWRVPEAAIGQICICVFADDDAPKFSFGLLRVEESDVDAEASQLSADAVARVRWIWHEHDLPENILKTLPSGDVQAIFAMSGKGNGQVRVEELLRRVQGRIIPRRLTLMVAHQLDPMKRPRTARDNLQPQGILVLGHQNDHPRICREFGLEVPAKGELTAIRVIKATMPRQIGRTFVRIDGADWVRAEPTEPDEPGPVNY